MENKLKYYRQLNGISQLQLSYKTKIANTIISGIESGKVYPFLGWKQKISEALNESIENIFGE